MKVKTTMEFSTKEMRDILSDHLKEKMKLSSGSSLTVEFGFPSNDSDPMAVITIHESPVHRSGKGV